jgi:hypothetical protein
MVRFYIPIPSFFIHLMAGIFSKLGGGINRINSLFNLVVMKTENDLTLLGLNLRPIDVGLHASGLNVRRELILEGLAFHVYLVGAEPKRVYIRTYVRAIEKLRNGLPLGIPFAPKFWPFQIALLDIKSPEPSSWVREFKWRLGAMTLLAEAGPLGAINYLGAKGAGGILISFIEIMIAILTEIFFKFCRFFLAPIIKQVFFRKLKWVNES